LNGRRVASVQDNILPPGDHRVRFSTKILVPGIYIVRFSGTESQDGGIKKLVVVRKE